MTLTLRRTALLLSLLAVAGVALVSVNALRAGPRVPADQASLLPANLSAIVNPSTALTGVPEKASVFGPLQPSAGEVHQLGNGAVAWLAQSQICWIAEGAGGCAPELAQPITWSAKDPDASGAGQPASVFGLAVDAVESVTARLDDGRTVSAKPESNFFAATLPSDAEPGNLTGVDATLANGAVVKLPVSQPSNARPAP